MRPCAMASANTPQAEPAAAGSSTSTATPPAPGNSRAVASPTAPGGPASQSLGAAFEVTVEPVSPRELNAWRRGFTPQAEIWNGRLAMLGLSLGLAALLISRLGVH